MSSGFGVSFRQMRRNALVYVLRARRRAGLKDIPEFVYDRGSLELSSLIEEVTEELDKDAETNNVIASIEMGGELTDFSLQDMKRYMKRPSVSSICTRTPLRL